MDYNSYYTASGELNTSYIIAAIIVAVLLIVACWRIFEKAGEKGWKAIIPFYDMYIACKIALGNGWFFLLFFVPFVDFFFGIYFNYKLSKAFGHGIPFTIGLVLIPNLFTLILGFGKSEYHGVQ